LMQDGRRSADIAREWQARYADEQPRVHTLLSYGSVCRHILPRLGDFELCQLRPELVESFAADLRAAGPTLSFFESRAANEVRVGEPETRCT
jgi:hypothetical protein